MEIFLVVHPHCRLPFLSEADAPFDRYLGFMTKIVDAAPSDDNALVITDNRTHPYHYTSHNLLMPRRNLFYSTKNPHDLLGAKQRALIVLD